MEAVRTEGSVVDRVGVVLIGLSVAWGSIVAVASRRSALPIVGLLLLATASLVAGRVLGCRSRQGVPGLVLLVVGGTFIILGVFDGGSLGDSIDPLGYPNASAGLAVFGSIAGMMLAFGGPSPAMRISGLIGAVGFGLVPFALEAQTAGFMIAALAAALGVVAVSGKARVGIVAACTTFVLVLGMTLALGISYRLDDRQGALDQLVDVSLGQRRLALWSDAIAITANHPLFGVGPGGFPFVSRVALRDADTRQAHNEFLQQGAEAGIPGLLLSTLLFLWGFARLFVVRGADAITFLGAGALLAVGVEASVDYVLHFPAVALVGACLVGAAQAEPAQVPQCGVSDQGGARPPRSSS